MKLENKNKKTELSTSDIRRIFANVSLFSEIYEDEGVIKLAQSSEILVHNTANITLIKHGEVGTDTYIMLSGEVEILVDSLSGDRFVVAVVHTDMENKNVPIIGENALLNITQKRTATVRTTTPSMFLVIKSKTFANIIKKYPHIGVHVYRKMCESVITNLERSNKNVATLFNAYREEIFPETVTDNSQE